MRAIAFRFSKATKSSPMLSCAQTAGRAMQRMPAHPKAELMIAVVALSRSQSSRTSAWFFASHYACARLPFAAAVKSIFFPTRVVPTKVTALTRGSVSIASASWWLQSGEVHDPLGEARFFIEEFEDTHRREQGGGSRLEHDSVPCRDCEQTIQPQGNHHREVERNDARHDPQRHAIVCSRTRWSLRGARTLIARGSAQASSWAQWPSECRRPPRSGSCRAPLNTTASVPRGGFRVRSAT